MFTDGKSECDFEITGETAEEMGSNGKPHCMEAHPELVEAWKNMPKEEAEKWYKEFEANFANLEDA